MKKLAIFAAAVFLVVAAVIISFKMYDEHIFNENKEANSCAKLAYNILSEWCEQNKTEMSELADEYRAGKTFDLSADGEGFAHFLHEEMNKSCGVYNGYVFIGVGEKDGDDVVFTQWSKHNGGSVTGQYPDGLFLNEYGASRIEFGSYYKH